MDENKKEPENRSSKQEPTGIPGKAWDSHHLADLCEDVAAGPGERVTIEPDIYARIEEEARRRGVSPETLIQVWLVERLEEGKRS